MYVIVLFIKFWLLGLFLVVLVDSGSVVSSLSLSDVTILGVTRVTLGRLRSAYLWLVFVVSFVVLVVVVGAEVVVVVRVVVVVMLGVVPGVVAGLVSCPCVDTTAA